MRQVTLRSVVTSTGMKLSRRVLVMQGASYPVPHPISNHHRAAQQHVPARHDRNTLPRAIDPFYISRISFRYSRSAVSASLSKKRREAAAEEVSSRLVRVAYLEFVRISGWRSGAKNVKTRT